MDLLGAPTETDLVEMGLQHPGLYYTVGALKIIFFLGCTG